MSSHSKKIASFALLAATTLVVAACSSNDSPRPMAPAPTPINFAPTLSGIADRTSDQDTVVGPIEFGVADRESDAALLTVTAVADGTDVVPADGVTLGGSGAVRTITLTPLEAAKGSVKITLTVTDPQGAVALRAFQVTVTARTASIRDVALATFAKGGSDEPTVVNGVTFIQDADDPAIFQPLMGTEE